MGTYGGFIGRYFEEYSAERKSNMQDYTPKEVAELLARLTESAIGDRPITICDGAAGTGSLLIAKWWQCKSEGANVIVMATEYADKDRKSVV